MYNLFETELGAVVFSKPIVSEVILFEGHANQHTCCNWRVRTVTDQGTVQGGSSESHCPWNQVWCPFISTYPTNESVDNPAN